MADTAIEIPKASWVRLEIEPVQVNVDSDTTVNFATIQSIVPGAHGLYYRDDGERKALLFDNNTGKVFPPPNGWDSVPVFIHLAHGSRNKAHFADYSKANEAFEKNITAVQRLFAAAGLGNASRVYNTNKTRARSSSKRNHPKSGFEAQPENAIIGEESEEAVDKIDPLVEKLKLKNAELKSRIKEYKNELHAANQKIKKLENEGEDKSSHDYSEKDEEINNLHTVIEELRNKLSQAESIKKNVESELGENQERLKNAKDKVAYLEGQLIISGEQKRERQISESQDETKSATIRSLEVKLQLANNSIRQLESEKQQLQESNWYANERIGKLEQENGYLKGITEQLKARADNAACDKLLKESEKRVWEINDEKSKLEWRIGELTQWWNDAKWKVGELESSIAQQRYLLDTANVKIQNLTDQNHSTPQPSLTCPTEGFTLCQGQQGAWQLANGPAPHIFGAGAISTIPMVPSFVPYGAPTVAMPGHSDTRTVTLTIPNVEGEAFLTGSFMNWKCALKCDILKNNKKGVVVNLPRGRHEFRFMTNGQWVTSSEYQLVPNGLGGDNNVVFVE
ncbi:unnamed protein product [Caenorhabditis bovis]|uniref:AMP-activated protein kinase glycogen-binding domain-containing protein n=1 Tax=Caenorhabditis bovis TaxID=2654633 RepID=A0A8S1ECV3_9PELO|nr:unnamed protein product [Caenorhabditis bovis]